VEHHRPAAGQAQPLAGGRLVRHVVDVEERPGLHHLVGDHPELGRETDQRRVGPDDGVHLRHQRPVHEQLVADRVHRDRDPGGARHGQAQRQQVAGDVVDDHVGVAEAGARDRVAAVAGARRHQPGAEAHAQDGVDVERAQPVHVEDVLDVDRGVEPLERARQGGGAGDVADAARDGRQHDDVHRTSARAGSGSA
jgi:hypothetical protein